MDYIDSRYINEVKNGTYTYCGSKQGLKGIIDSQNDVGGYPTSSNFEHSTDGMCNASNDTDRDGMPDVWEKEHGLNPNDASDGSIVSLSGDDYSNLEMFLNELAGDPVEYNGKGMIAAEIDTGYKYTITNVGSGLPLEVVGSSTQDGANVRQGTSGISGWFFEKAEDGYYRIISEAGNGKAYYLGVEDGKTTNGANIAVWTDSSSDAAQFKLYENDDGSYKICTKVTSDASCLGVSSGSSEDGANVIQWVSDGTDSQKWFLKIKLDPLNGTLIQNLNINHPEYYHSWSINDTLASGDAVFGDREGVTYSEIPQQLEGTEAIVTPCDAKTLTTDLASFTAGQNMTVYIVMDQRVTPRPAWLSDWTMTDLTITNNKNVSFVVYSKQVSQGENILLGTNGQSSGCVNYTVLASAADSAVIGDVNADGEFTVADVVMMQKWLICVPDVTLTDWKAGDLCEDNCIDVFDLCIMKRLLLSR